MLLRPMRKYAAAGLGCAVLAAGLTLVAPSAGATTLPTAPKPDQVALTWLTGQLGSDNLLGGDLATTIDFGIALAQAGGDPATLDRITTAVNDGIGAYAIGDGTDGVNAAQAALYFDAIGVDPTTIDGNLITKVEVATDDTTGKTKALYGYEGAWSQWLAVRALNLAGSAEASKATSYLLGMQCGDGGWGGDACSTGADPDDTADALFALFPMQGSSQAIDDAIAAGVSWLQTNQKTDGGFDPGWGENTSSTALAARALWMAGDTSSARDAVSWVRALQVTGSPCDGELSADGGAVAYAADRIANGRTDGIAADNGAKYDWYATTVQAFQVLDHAVQYNGDNYVTSAPFIKAGGRAEVVVGLSRGQHGCLSVAGRNHDVWDLYREGSVFYLPNVTHTYTAVLRIPGASVSSTFVTLAPKTLPVAHSLNRVAKGGSEKITVSGLFPGEPVRLGYGGATVASGVANSSGRFIRSIAVGRSAGTKTVYAVGRFATRKGQTSFTVR